MAKEVKKTPAQIERAEKLKVSKEIEASLLETVEEFGACLDTKVEEMAGFAKSYLDAVEAYDRAIRSRSPNHSGYGGITKLLSLFHSIVSVATDKPRYRKSDGSQLPPHTLRKINR